jgi:non-specific serine/threonine protein kinase
LAIFSALGDRELLAFAWCRAAGVATSLGRPERAARLLGAAAAAFEAIGFRVPRHWEGRVVRLEAAARAALGDEAFAAAWAAGRALPLEAAVAEADAVLAEEEAAAPEASAEPAVDAVAHKTGLTPREREVLRLIADGRSDKEVAALLAISPRTVARHLENIRAKLGVDSRAAAAAHAVRDGLV